jgi:renalase
MHPPLRELSVAVIGAGISGLAAARELAPLCNAVRVFEKSRGPGGRISTRRTGLGVTFDHGTQYFTVRDIAFAREVDAWAAADVVEAWRGHIVRIATGPAGARIIGDAAARGSFAPPVVYTDPVDDGELRFTGVPGMSAIARHLAVGTDVAYDARVARAVHDGTKWELRGEHDEDLGAWDVLIVSAPAPQTEALLREAAPEIAAAAATAVMQPCWAAMLGLSQPSGLAFAAAFVGSTGESGGTVGTDGPLAWIARNSSKPGRVVPADSRVAETWVLHAGRAWSLAHVDESPEWAANVMYRAFLALIPGRIESANRAGPLADPLLLESHRWRFAFVAEPLGRPCLWDARLRVGACGDWCIGPRVEAAWMSGMALAAAVAAG